MAKRAESTPLSRWALGWAMRGAVLAACCVAALVAWWIADPYPRYVRPASLFFRQVLPPPVFRYVASGSLAPNFRPGDRLSLANGGKVIQRSFSPRWRVVQAARTTTPPGIAVAFIADCSMSMTSSDPGQLRFQEARRLISKMGTGDTVAFGTFNETPELLSDWATRDAVAVPSQGQIRPGASTFTDTGWLVRLFGEGTVAGKRRVAIFLSDLLMSDGEYVRVAARVLAEQGVSVYAIRFGAGASGLEGVDPNLLETCRSSGGDVFNGQSAQDIGGMVDRIQRQLSNRTLDGYDARVVFESTQKLQPGDRVGIEIGGRSADLVIGGR